MNQGNGRDRSVFLSEKLSASITSRLLPPGPAADELSKRIDNFLYGSLELQRTGWTPAEVEKALDRNSDYLSVVLDAIRDTTSGAATPSQVSASIYENAAANKARAVESYFAAGTITDESRPALLKADMDNNRREIIRILQSADSASLLATLQKLERVQAALLKAALANLSGPKQEMLSMQFAFDGVITMLKESLLKPAQKL